MKEKGITLIALVVTIVVLLILAGVSISMLTGENGIVTQASKAKDETEQARVEELVDLAVNSLIGENMGSTNGITPQMVAEEVNEMENRNDVYAEGSEFPTKIIFPEEEREVEVDLEQKVDLSEMYEVAVDEDDIALATSLLIALATSSSLDTIVPFTSVMSFIASMRFNLVTNSDSVPIFSILDPTL